MNIAIIDISGTVDEYSAYLSEAVYNNKSSNDSVVFFCPPSKALRNISYKHLITFVPLKYKRSYALWKRALKALETIVNYFYVVLYIAKAEIDIVHFQWFPFLEIVGIERLFLKAIRTLSPKTKIVYTHHNVYPHNSSERKKLVYKKRFCRIEPMIDMIVCHTQSTMSEIQNEFSISNSKISVQYHGIFFPRERFEIKRNSSGKFRILMYGLQEPYKGTDLFVDAIDMLSQEIKDQLDVYIVGGIKESYLAELKEKSVKNNIHWRPERVSNEELYSYIASSEMLVYPYRNISQSGALLLGLFFKKYIIASNLPSFKETLYNFKEQWFFKTDDSLSLSSTITEFIKNQSMLQEQADCIEELNKKYSWDNVASSTISMYKLLLCNNQ